MRITSKFSFAFSSICKGEYVEEGEEERGEGEGEKGIQGVDGGFVRIFRIFD